MTHADMMAAMSRLMALKQANDVEGLTAMYSPDCVLEQPSLGIRRVGRDAIRPQLARFGQAFPDYHRAFEGAASDGRTLVSWGEARMTLHGEFDGHRPNGRQARVMTFVLFGFDEAGLIARESHNWDLATLCRQSGVPVAAMETSMGLAV